MKIERLTENNVDLYLEYLKKAMSLEPNLMVAEYIDEIGIRNRVRDDFYMNTTSLLAIVDNSVVGRIEYHFYGCMQDGYRMAYVDWIYVLPEFRHQGIARQLFEEFEKDCIKNRINQFYLIRATNSNADKFYCSFEGVSFSEAPLLRKDL
ncbi:GNAT family N-acetyltransferase [Treponema sp. OMZ 788]|uniref:GNAT family N-acetyltransferase n=1 Tax=Treponema sp. OMZ 788 TaxID=2563664 RepID=UPI0020A59644|nr:GNAT family N-acetyltransferase [Treponema sp. OMZ 788]UTC64963.1 GNAT family N-acetyltransferase [Treponema sp. OMZ 788]